MNDRATIAAAYAAGALSTFGAITIGILCAAAAKTMRQRREHRRHVHVPVFAPDPAHNPTVVVPMHRPEAE